MEVGEGDKDSDDSHAERAPDVRGTQAQEDVLCLHLALDQLTP